jgi:hypothetical protein
MMASEFMKDWVMRQEANRAHLKVELTPLLDELLNRAALMMTIKEVQLQAAQDELEQIKNDKRSASKGVYR